MNQEKSYTKRVEQAIQERGASLDKLQARDKELTEEIAALQAENLELEKLMKLGGTLGEARANQYATNNEELRFLKAQLEAVLYEILAVTDDNIDLIEQKGEVRKRGGTIAEA